MLYFVKPGQGKEHGGKYTHTYIQPTQIILSTLDEDLVLFHEHSTYRSSLKELHVQQSTMNNAHFPLNNENFCIYNAVVYTLFF